jgi:hypothetical protein
MRPIVYLFNICGFVTSWCCYGHDKYNRCYIVFDNNTEDSKIEDLVRFMSYPNYPHGYFNKRIQYYNDKIEYKWIWDAPFDKDNHINGMMIHLYHYYQSKNIEE